MRRHIWIAGLTALAVATACGDDGAGGPGSVALLADTLNFDYDTLDAGSEASQMEHTLKSFGITVNVVRTLDSATIATALANTRVLVIPESFASFDDSLKGPAQAVIRDWVDSTGGLIIINPNTTNRQVLDSLFNYAITTSATGVDRSFLDAAEAAGTPFEGGPSVIWDVSAVAELDPVSMPAGTSVIYAGNAGEVTVALIPQGNGVVVLLGWDWFNAAPNGPSDGGWLEVLKRAVRN